MDTYVQKDFSKILKNNAQSLRHDKLPEGTDVFRIYDRNLEVFPVTVDLYSNYARVVDYGDVIMTDEVREICLDIISRFAYVDRDKIIYLYRSKREKGQQHEKNQAEPVIVSVKENNLVFKTDLSSYADSGLFLDHVNTRSFIKQSSAGMDVLNLFSYTGSFSVYAASGLAKSVTSVDLSATYTKWAEENLSSNGFEGETYKCVCMDASKFVDDMMNNNQRYDIIIFDPPSFSNSHKMEHDFDVQRDFYYWIKRLTGILRKGGFILFSTNLGSFKMDKRRLKGLSVKELTNIMWAEGFVKGRKGTVRSWIMSMNDDSLSLDWSEDKKSAPVKRDRAERRDYKSSDRPRRNYDDRGYDRPRREHSDSERRSSYESRSSYEHRDDRPRYGRRDDRPRYRHSEDDRRSSYSRREDDRSFRPRREHSDTERRFSHERRDSYKHRDSYEHREDRPRYGHSEDSRKSSAKREKPYGYDTFKPARNRNDSSDFFWNSDDLKPKK